MVATYARRITFVLAPLLIMFGALAAVSSTTYAYNPLDSVCDSANVDAQKQDKDESKLSANDPQNSVPCSDKSTDNTITGNSGIILRITYIVATVAGIIAVIMIIMAGAKMITSGGDANAVKESRTKLLHAVIGLVIIALAQTIVVFVVNKFIS